MLGRGCVLGRDCVLGRGCVLGRAGMLPATDLTRPLLGLVSQPPTAGIGQHRARRGQLI
ncbi:hypothetical protein [Corynebacterium sp. HMSC28B08]|uniref:hypothetical protein n=1 Tax=Corynebacterium sp. HMSC28B08 TaxID=1581066 RepID=UPI00352CA9F9